MLRSRALAARCQNWHDSYVLCCGHHCGTAQVFLSTQAGLMVLVVLAISGRFVRKFHSPAHDPLRFTIRCIRRAARAAHFHVELSVYAFVGIILLIGIVKKNAIMMVDFALEFERTEKGSAEHSIVEAAHVRFRPIMMTTVAALVGTLPIAFARGAGAETRQPLGIAVVGGLAFSQFITLYITPVVYTYVDNWNRRLEGKLSRKSKRAAQPVPAGEQLDLGVMR
jgi:HAE1 family hydrophobic/amphiphilic exporter-1